MRLPGSDSVRRPAGMQIAERGFTPAVAVGVESAGGITRLGAISISIEEIRDVSHLDALALDTLLVAGPLGLLQRRGGVLPGALAPLRTCRAKVGLARAMNTSVGALFVVSRPGGCGMHPCL